MGEWLYDFCRKKINEFPDILKNIYDIEFLQIQLEKIKNKTNEESWHIVTNPINILMNYEFFKEETDSNSEK